MQRFQATNSTLGKQVPWQLHPIAAVSTNIHEADRRQPVGSEYVGDADQPWDCNAITEV